MLKQLAFFLPLVIFTSCAFAYDIEGTILDYDGEPLVDARVALLTRQRVEVGRTYTGRNGHYRIRDIPAGTYTMEITKTGERPFKHDVSVSGPHYRSTVYRDIDLSDIPRFESIQPSELKALFLPDDETIPVKAFSNYQRGVRRMKDQKYRRALRSFERAISQYPEFSRCYTYIGQINVENKDYDKAEKNFRKAIELNPQDPIPLTHFGRLLLELSRYKDAETHLNKAVELDSGRAENYFLLGQAEYYSGKRNDAEMTILRGLMMQPRQAGKARLVMADIYDEQKRYSKAHEMLSAYLRDNPFSDDRTEIQERIQDLNEKIMQIETVSDGD
jgi:Tfp pilus assembly protein PilF